LTANEEVKLGDFGIAKVLNHTLDTTKSIVGTPYYLSPEIIQNKPHGLESDIWSLGVLLYEMCALKPPFNARNLSALAMKITAGIYAPIPSQYSKDLKMLIASLLVTNPKKRLTINKVLKSSFIQARMQGNVAYTSVREESGRKEIQKRMAEKKINGKLHNQSVIHNIQNQFSTNETPCITSRKSKRHSKETDDDSIIIEQEEISNKVREVREMVNKLQGKMSRQDHVVSTIKKVPSTVMQIKKFEMDPVSSPIRPLSPKIKSDQYSQERMERIKKREEERKKMKEEILKLKKQSKGKREIPVCLVQHNYSTIATDADLSEPSSAKIPFIKPCNLMPQKSLITKNYPNTTRNSINKRIVDRKSEVEKLKLKKNEENYLNQFINPSSNTKQPSPCKDKVIEEEEKHLPEEKRTLKEVIKKMRKKQLEFSGKKTLEEFSEKDILITRTNTVNVDERPQEEDKETLSPKQSKVNEKVMARTAPVKQDIISEFETIESIVFYLETEYGFEKFKEIYQVIKDAEEDADEKLLLKTYAEKLKGIIDEEALARSLFLFLSLKRAEEQAVNN